MIFQNIENLNLHKSSERAQTISDSLQVSGSASYNIMQGQVLIFWISDKFCLSKLKDFNWGKIKISG